MTDEEKKAIEILGEFKKNGFHLLNLKYESRVSTTKHIENSIETILNLIEKQSKEIEELKKPKYIIDFKTNEIKTLTNDFISKDKIKAKIEELQEDIKYSANPLSIDNSKFGIKVLQSLLEKVGENNATTEQMH